MKQKIPENILSLKPYKPGKPIEELERESMDVDELVRKLKWDVVKVRGK